MSQDLHNIGAEIRRLRKWRGMTLDALAGQAGMTKGYLSKIENGHTALERRSTIKAIADALRVSVGDLTGAGYLADRSLQNAGGAIPDIRLALASTSLDGAGPFATATRTMAELAPEAQRVAEARQLLRADEVGRALPPLLIDLHAVAEGGAGDDRPAALRSIVQAAQTSTLFLKNFGEYDLALTAAERGHQAAVLLDDPVFVAASEFARVQALIGLGAYERADALARHASQILTPTTEVDLEIYGMAVLTAAFTGQFFDTDPEEALREARAVADQAPGTNAFWMNFSRTNVDLWRISIALEAGDPVKAAEVAGQVRLEDIPAKSRRLSFLVDHARALHALRGYDDEVVRLLRKAEKLGPDRTRHDVWVREIVTELLLRSRRDAGGRELRGLADRMGMLATLGA
jgi:transcriptional regulator with XRE-family HTH domain